VYVRVRVSDAGTGIGEKLIADDRIGPPTS
jgi:hypothetical protein